jgi:hypothetical protein
MHLHCSSGHLSHRYSCDLKFRGPFMLWCAACSVGGGGGAGTYNSDAQTGTAGAGGGKQLGVLCQPHSAYTCLTVLSCAVVPSAAETTMSDVCIGHLWLSF